MNYKSEIQKKNIAWLLPRPKKDKYKGGMPLYAEEWLIKLACEILNGHQETWGIGSSKMNLLNVFCGMNKHGFRVDFNPEVKPDLISDPNPKKYKIVKRVFIGTRTYHIPRVALFFKKN